MHRNPAHNTHFGSDDDQYNSGGYSPHRIHLNTEEKHHPDEIRLHTSRNLSNTLHIPHVPQQAPQRQAASKSEPLVIKDQEKVSQEELIQQTRNQLNESLPQQEKRARLSWGQKIWEFFKFSLTAATIFAVVFVGFNFSAFSKIAEKYIYPERLEQKQIALENILEETDSKSIQLLPTAGVEKQGRKDYLPLNIKVTPLENRLIIAEHPVVLNVPIVSVSSEPLLRGDFVENEEVIQEGLKDGVVHHPGTALPGQRGNFFVTGHSSDYPWKDGDYKDVFVLLHDLEVGDEYTVFWEQKRYNYRIREIKVVSPQETSVLDQPKNEHISTLMTCTPVGTAKNRLIIIADLI
jgi:LPXTG-site transpeptidase (sortase) family protein